jgi:hypothetical protein
VTALRLVPRRRPSVVVDLEHGERMTPPLTMAEIEAMVDGRGRIPHDVFCGMWVAAWARAEHCPYNVLPHGYLEPHCRYTPSDDLWVATAQSMRQLVGCLGFAIPLAFDGRQRAFGASWPMTFGTSGRGSRN